ncbi:hypothetical protein ACFOON_13110 [Novosphingobium piscinae]|uniref:Uncharacterized protein n=1 Tax=Novosphingobium piscinae TaxID=1507448 RepID=A0A7X1FZI0_9SPHN|nr:hypothetical protein [Novosphingobium piscinae]MBC2669714.1 hypothetical protein [Novosphingobium piscinae]
MHILIAIALFIAIAVASSTKEGRAEFRNSPTYKTMERISWWGIALIVGLFLLTEFWPRSSP